MSGKGERLRDIFRIKDLLFLLEGALAYGLGVAIARYLGKPLDPGLYLLGQALVTLLQLATHFLYIYFHGPVATQQQVDSATFDDLGQNIIPGGQLQRLSMYSTIACLTLAASLASILLFNHRVPTLAWLVLALGLIGSLLYSLPPISLVTSGFGEITASLTLAGLLPAFAYTLQTAQFHRLLWMTTPPLIALHFSMLIAFQLPRYASDLRSNKPTLMVRLGWPVAMRMHDIAILLAIVSMILAFLNGLPRRVALGSMITFPLALAQIWQLWRIRSGFPPRWRTLTLGAAILFGLTAYLELAGYLLS